MTPAVELKNVSYAYGARASLFSKGTSHIAVNNVSCRAMPGRCIGIIGESGSGKSTLARLIMGIHRPSTGKILIDGANAEDIGRAELSRRIQMVFQNPNASLDPAWPIWRSIAEGLLISGAPRREAREQALALMESISLDASLADRRPHALSGGQRQRVAIARALAVGPSTLVLDEPTSALDLTVQAGFLNLLLDLQEKQALTYILITHDIDVIRHLAHETYVMYRGEILEHGPTADLLSSPRHAYTQTLVDASPRIEGAAT